MDQQLLMEASQLEKYSNELEQHEAYLAQHINELMQFSEQLEILNQTNETSMLASIGKRVYLKTEVVDKSLFVEVGAGVVVRKTPEELATVITEQLTQLRASHEQLKLQLAFSTEKLQQIMAVLEQQHQHAETA